MGKSMYRELSKRSFDVFFSGIGILLCLPLFILISLLIMMKDHGPVLFVQKRVGRHGRPFHIYKFRTMKQRAVDTKGVFMPGNNSYVTPVGKFLRKTKLDEIPQLINVLKGDMSLVGPRPEVPEWVDVYPEKWAEVLSIRPGITDNASLEFKDEEYILAASSNPEKTYKETILPKKLDLYLEYVHNHSVGRDVLLILNTIKEVLFYNKTR